MKPDLRSPREKSLISPKSKIVLGPKRRPMPGEKTDQEKQSLSSDEEGVARTPQQKLVKRKSRGLDDSPVFEETGKPQGTDKPLLPLRPKTITTPTKTLQPHPLVTTNKQPLAQSRAGLDLPSLSQKPIKFLKLLKGDEIKVASLLDIGGERYVVKAGVGNGHIVDNLINTDLIRELDIPGVRAPFAARLTDGFRTALQKGLNKTNPLDKTVLEALGNNDQIATTAPGFTVQDILASETHNLKREWLRSIQGKNTEEAVTALSAKLEQQLSTVEIKLSKAAASVQKLRNSATRAEAIDELKTRLQLDKNKELLSVIAAVVQQSPDIVVNSTTAELDSLDRAKQALGRRVKSEEGAFALGGLGIVDLLCGMDDRILSKWNPSNFMFDPQENEMWCVDNAKSEHLGISTKNDDQWKRWVVERFADGGDDNVQSIAEHLHFAIYDRDYDKGGSDFSKHFKLTDEERVATKIGIDKAVRQTLAEIQALTDGLHSRLTVEARARLKDRLEVVKARVAFTDLLKFDEALVEVPAVTKPGALEKVSRIAKSRDQQQKRAETIKDQVRKKKTGVATLLSLENELLIMKTPSDEQDDAGDPDRRVNKALFEVRFRRLLLDLETRNANLAELYLSKEKPWGQLTPETIENLRNGAAPWFQSLRALGDKDGEKQLNKALDNLANTVVKLSPVAKLNQVQ